MKESVANDEITTATRERRWSPSCRSSARLIVLLLGVIALACSTFAFLSCEFFQLTTTIANATTLEEPSSVTFDRHIGLFSIQADPTDDNNATICINYEDFFDSFETSVDWNNRFWTAAQYSSIVAPALGITAWILTLWEYLCGSFCGSFSLPILLYTFASLIQGCTFLAFAEKDVCSQDGGNLSAGNDTTSMPWTVTGSSCLLSTGSYLSIAAILIYYAVVIILCAIPRPDQFCCAEDSQHDYEKYNQDDYNDTRGNNDAATMDVPAVWKNNTRKDKEMPSSPSKGRTAEEDEDDPEAGGDKPTTTSPSQQRKVSWQEVY